MAVDHARQALAGSAPIGPQVVKAIATDHDLLAALSAKLR
jgi:hypothetical protein